MNSTITDQIDQMENPTCSATIDQIRLRLATFAPPDSHAETSSASQSWMLRSRVNIDIVALRAGMRSAQGSRPTVMRRLPVGIRRVNTRSHSAQGPGCETVFTPASWRKRPGNTNHLVIGG